MDTWEIRSKNDRKIIQITKREDMEAKAKVL